MIDVNGTAPAIRCPTWAADARGLQRPESFCQSA